jgi:hypothetical protein
VIAQRIAMPNRQSADRHPQLILPRRQTTAASNVTLHGQGAAGRPCAAAAYRFRSDGVARDEAPRVPAVDAQQTRCAARQSERAT